MTALDGPAPPAGPAPPLPPDAPRRIFVLARAEGFDAAGIAPPDLPQEAVHLDAWLNAGHAAGMDWIGRERATRLDLRRRLPWARSVVVVAKRYYPPELDGTPAGGLARYVSVYARGRDYHDVLRPRLQRLGERIAQEIAGGGMRWRLYVDTGPLLERQLAAAAGIGWLGKNTLLLLPRGGSWFFLGTLVTDLALERANASPGAMPPSLGSCGRCVACQPACPTDALVEPGVLDARRCISYLTIEHRGPIERSLRRAMGGWLFGCDLCQSACPFNFKARSLPAPDVQEFAPHPALTGIDLPELLRMDKAAFTARFRGTALTRPRREGLLRNALIVAANLGRTDCLPAARTLLGDRSPTLREAASWCLAELGDRAAAPQLARTRDGEAVEWVRAAMESDLARIVAL